MYTECPECSTAFRVTAKVLQQAAGRVRCGGCGHAFSALEHLTEEMPAARGEQQDIAAEAAPTAAAADDLTSEERFKETSKQLLQTLSELTGTDEVRIEDTGIEWHVVDDEEDDGEEEDVAADTADASAMLEELADEDDDSGDFLELAEEEDEANEVGIAAEAAPTRTVSGEAVTPAELALADDQATDLAVSESGEWQELSNDDDAAAGDDIPIEVEEELAAIHSELSTIDDRDTAAPDDLDSSAPDDLDSQFEMQAEAMGIDLSGAHEVDADAAGVAADAGATEDIVSRPLQVDEEDAAAEEITIAGDDGIAAEVAPMKSAGEEATSTDPEEDQELIAAAFTPDAEVIELSLASDPSESVTDPVPHNEPEYRASDSLPRPSEEEMTINQEIDQELLAIASQDEDLGATIVGLNSLEKNNEEEDEPGPEVETIIMEGDQIRGAFEKERERQKREAALKRFDQAGNLIDSYVARRIVRGGRRSTDPLGYGMIAGVLLLVICLFGQIVHAKRQTLSTSALFNQTVGHVYRMLGNPINPEWSITGWQFEATNGSIADDEDVLTIYSRIGNRSSEPLPYPLVHVSLTDRWEEIIGSAILEPSAYLAADQNPNQPVGPGNNFTAVITIDEPSVDATGFKLNVCYRVTAGRVRCATEDFKD